MVSTVSANALTGGKAPIHFKIAGRPTTAGSFGGMKWASVEYMFDAAVQSARSTRAVKLSVVARTAARSASLKGRLGGMHASAAAPRAMAGRTVGRMGCLLSGIRRGGPGTYSAPEQGQVRREASSNGVKQRRQAETSSRGI